MSTRRSNMREYIEVCKRRPQNLYKHCKFEISRIDDHNYVEYYQKYFKARTNHIFMDVDKYIPGNTYFTNYIKRGHKIHMFLSEQQLISPTQLESFCRPMYQECHTRINVHIPSNIYSDRFIHEIQHLDTPIRAMRIRMNKPVIFISEELFGNSHTMGIKVEYDSVFSEYHVYAINFPR